MRILNLHGLNGSRENTNYKFLCEYYKGNQDVEIISPQIDYANTDPYIVIVYLLNSFKDIDIVVGNSFGGFFAYVLGYMMKAKTVLFNPCVPPANYIPNLVEDYRYSEELSDIWNSCKGLNNEYSLLLGASDDVLDINVTLNILNPSNENYAIISGGHSLKGEEYESWFKEQLR